MNVVGSVCLLSIVLAQAPIDIGEQRPDEVVFHCDFETDRWSQQWGQSKAPARAALVSADPTRRFEPLAGRHFVSTSIEAATTG